MIRSLPLLLLSLRPGLSFALTLPDSEDTLPLLEPVTIPRADLDTGGGRITFEAWFLLSGKKRLVGGLLLDLLTLDDDHAAQTGTAANQPGKSQAVVAFVSNCPHEACKVRLEPDPQATLSLATDGFSVPDRPILFCPCHFSMFDPNRDGARLGGPAYRGLYRFILREQGSSIVISHVESAVAALFSS